MELNQFKNKEEKPIETVINKNVVLIFPIINDSAFFVLEYAYKLNKPIIHSNINKGIKILNLLNKQAIKPIAKILSHKASNLAP